MTTLKKISEATTKCKSFMSVKNLYRGFFIFFGVCVCETTYTIEYQEFI